MSRALWLPDALRGAGLNVHEVDGWRSRGSDSFDPYGVIVHATAGSRTSTDAGEIRVLLNGSNTAPPPIAQLYIGRNGHVHVVASGRCNHALTGQAGNLRGYGNSRLIGIEAANDNRGEPWPAVQYDAYLRTVAAICRQMHWGGGRVSGHKEHQPGSKSDPTFSMADFRNRVDAILHTGSPQPIPQPQPQPGDGAWHAGGLQLGSRNLWRANPMMRGEDVRDVQQFIGSKRAGGADGVFGDNTRAGVIWYQGMRGITKDGIVGPVTRRHILTGR